MMIELNKNTKLDRDAWLRLMGVSEEHLVKAETDEKMRISIDRLQEQMEEAEALLFDAAQPCFAYKSLRRNQFEIKGTSLTKHLEGCEEVIIMAVTLGAAVDQLIDETQKTRIALGVTIDSGASVMTELAADLAEEQIRREIARTHEAFPDADMVTSDPPGDGASKSQPGGSGPLFLTPRFSPGYGDSPLEMQEQLLRELDAEKTLGIHLSKGFMMSPSKSITAILGLSDHPVSGRLATCAECVLRDKCQLRKNGATCW